MAKALEKMSDAELDDLLAKSQVATPVQQTKSVDHMSDDELDSLLAGSQSNAPVAPQFSKEQIAASENDPNLHFAPAHIDPEALKSNDYFAGFGKHIVQPVMENVVAPVGRTIDKYVQAPVRAAVGAVQAGENPISAYENQFGADPEAAPSYKQIAIKAGLPDKSLSQIAPQMYSETGEEPGKLQRGGMLDFSSAGAAGLGGDIALDPLNAVGVGEVYHGVEEATKMGGKALMKTADVGLQAAGKLGDVITATETAGNVARGTSRIVGKTAEKIGDVYESSKSIFSPRIAKGFDKLKQTAEKIEPGLSKELSAGAEFGHHSSADLLEGSLRDVNDKLKQKFAKTADKIQNAVDGAMENLSGGPVGGPMAAGDTVKAGYARAEEKILNNNALTYRSAAKLTPNMQISKGGAEKLASTLNGAEKNAKGLVMRGFGRQKQLGQEILDITSQLRKNTNYKQLSERIGYIGKLAKDAEVDPVVRNELWNIYHGVSDALVDSVHAISPQLADDLVQNNKNLSTFFKQRDQLGKLIQQESAAPEKVFKGILGDSKKVEALTSMLHPEELKAFRGSFLNSLIPRNAEGQIIYASALKNVNNKGEMLSKMFSKGELSEIKDVLELGHAHGSPVLNKSGSGILMKMTDIAHTIPRAVFGEEVLDKIKAGGRALGPESTLADVVGAAPAPAAVEAPLMQKIKQGAIGVGQQIPEVPGMLMDRVRGRINERSIPLKAAQVYTVQQYDQKGDFVTVPPGLSGEILKAIDAAQMSNTEKAIAINKLNKENKVSAEFFQRVNQPAQGGP